MNMTYTFHTDPGHGWLEVDRDELVRLGIDGNISQYSYERGDKVFLEEDCDAARFVNAKKAAGEEYLFRDAYKDNTPIRRYAPYKVRLNNADAVIRRALTAAGYSLQTKNGIITASHTKHGTFDFTEPKKLSTNLRG
jgi:hypothetical protein